MYGRVHSVLTSFFKSRYLPSLAFFFFMVKYIYTRFDLILFKFYICFSLKYSCLIIIFHCNNVHNTPRLQIFCFSNCPCSFQLNYFYCWKVSIDQYLFSKLLSIRFRLGFSDQVSKVVKKGIVRDILITINQKYVLINFLI